MTLQAIISILFRLINFGIFIALMIYVYKKYMYPLLVYEANQQQEALLELERQEHDTKRKRLVLDDQLHSDKQLIVELKKRMGTWVAAEREWRQSRQRYKEACIKKLEEKTAFKQIRIAEYMVEKDSMPLIVAQARQELIEQYKNDAKAKDYIECVINTLTQERALHEYR